MWIALLYFQNVRFEVETENVVVWVTENACHDSVEFSAFTQGNQINKENFSGATNLKKARLCWIIFIDLYSPFRINPYKSLFQKCPEFWQILFIVYKGDFYGFWQSQKLGIWPGKWSKTIVLKLCGVQLFVVSHLIKFLKYLMPQNGFSLKPISIHYTFGFKFIAT